MSVHSKSASDTRVRRAGVAFTVDGSHVAANYLNDHVYLFALDGVAELAAEAATAAQDAGGSCSGRTQRDCCPAGAYVMTVPWAEGSWLPWPGRARPCWKVAWPGGVLLDG